MKGKNYRNACIFSYPAGYFPKSIQYKFFILQFFAVSQLNIIARWYVNKAESANWHVSATKGTDPILDAIEIYEC